MPLISIITTTLNCASSLERTFKSIDAQSFEDYEYLIIDGASVDGTVELAREYAKKNKRVVVDSQADSGIYDAMNRGISMCSGEYVLFLGAGDTLYDFDVLMKVSHYEGINKADVLYGYALIVRETGEVYENKRYINRSYRFRADPIIHQAVFGRRELLVSNPFDVKYKIAADQDWIMKMYFQKRTFEYIDIPISYFYNGGVSTNAETNEMCLRELRRIHRNYYPGWYLLHTIGRIINAKFLHIKRYKNDRMLR